jgi:hypothetical protein
LVLKSKDLRELGREVVGMLRYGSMIVIARSVGIEAIGRCWMYLLDEVESRQASLVSREKEVKMGVKMMEWMNVMGVIMRMSAV